ncbi:hypothetical protein P7C70_g8161, partial [Phenoliferia sp. Uapishka_3]
MKSEGKSRGWKWTVEMKMDGQPSAVELDFSFVLSRIGDDYSSKRCTSWVTGATDSPRYLDVTFGFDGGRVLHSNSTFLSAESSYFKTLFSSGFSETLRQPQIETPNPPSDLLPTHANGKRPRASEDSDTEVDPPTLHPPTTSYRIKVKDTSYITDREDTSYITDREVLRWIHTKKIEFAKLKSTRSEDNVQPHAMDSTNATIPIIVPASPKFVYRLAHYLELNQLQSVALASLLEQISVTNVADELRSEVSALYEPIQEALVYFAATNWEKVQESEGWKKLEKNFEEGDVELAATFPKMLLKLTKLLKGAKASGCVQKAASTLQLNPPSPPKKSRKELKLKILVIHHIGPDATEALLRALFREYGAMLDVNLVLSRPNTSTSWIAGHNDYSSNLDVIFAFSNGRTLRGNAAALCAASEHFVRLFTPGFSETAITPQVAATFPPKKALSGSGGSKKRQRASHDSDVEAENNLPPPNPSPTPIVVNVNNTSYITYREVLCWIHSGDINFSPLSSSAKVSATKSESSTSLSTSASPKSVYCLADYLEIPRLKSIALAAILDRVSVANVAEELMSEVSTLYPPVQDSLLQYTAKNWAKVQQSEGWRKLEKDFEGEEGDLATMYPRMLIKLTKLFKEAK